VPTCYFTHISILAHIYKVLKIYFLRYIYCVVKYSIFILNCVYHFIYLYVYKIENIIYKENKKIILSLHFIILVPPRNEFLTLATGSKIDYPQIIKHTLIRLHKMFIFFYSRNSLSYHNLI
jgi:hypothetical protein